MADVRGDCRGRGGRRPSGGVRADLETEKEPTESDEGQTLPRHEVE